MLSTINFYLDKPQNIKTSSIIVSFSIDKKRLKISTGISINPTTWDKKKEAATPKADNYMYINDRISQIKFFIEDLFYQLNKVGNFQQDKFIQDIKLNLKKKNNPELIPKSKSLLQYYNEFINYMKLSNNVTDRTIKIYRLGYNRLKEFDKNVTFEQIDETFLIEYRNYLMKRYNYTYNGLAPLFKNSLFVFLNHCIKNGISNNLKFKNFKVVIKESENKIYLNEDELRKINDLNDLPNYLENARNWLMIMCFTGLRVSDALQLDKSKIILSENKINLTMKKTSSTVTIPIIEPAKEFIVKLLDGGIRIISSQKLNEYYKELGKLAGIDNEITIIKYGQKKVETKVKKYELITNHSFRRSYATNCLLRGIQPEKIMKITGHRTLSSFEAYIGFTVKEAFDTVMDNWSDFKL